MIFIKLIIYETLLVKNNGADCEDDSEKYNEFSCPCVHICGCCLPLLVKLPETQVSQNFTVKGIKNNVKVSRKIKRKFTLIVRLFD